MTLDQDAGEQPTVSVNGGTTLAQTADVHGVAFSVSGLATDDSGTLTFSDGTNSVTVTITDGVVVAGDHNTTTTVDLSSLSDDTSITSSLSLSDPAGNSFSASGNAVTLDQDATEQPTVVWTAARRRSDRRGAWRWRLRSAGSPPTTAAR